jgi:sec-independent protein translocase protein TatC
MSVPEDKNRETPVENTHVPKEGQPPADSGTDTAHTSYEQTTDHDYDSHYHSDAAYHDDPYSGQSYGAEPPSTSLETTPAVAPVVASTGGGSGSSTPPPSEEEEDDDDDGMLRMSFLEHLEELRKRIISALMGLGVAFGLALIFANEMWKAVSEPAATALKALGYPPYLSQIGPMDSFQVIYMKLPLLAAIFLSSPWILWQAWSFIAPGLYKKERSFAAPVILSTAGLFVLGGLFAYFVAFRFGLEFLLGIGKDINVVPNINMVDYFDLFVNVTLGIGVVFELPIIIFFLALLRIVTAKFLLEHSRYAILIIVIVAALITPTPDIFNLMLFAVPMVVLYFVGVFAAYLLQLRRDEKSFPWLSVLVVLLAVVGVAAAVVWALVAKYGYKVVPYWPFLLR